MTLENQALQAEIRAGLVTLARAVSHDVNNAIGSLLPLAEQVRDDLRSGDASRDTLVEDMDVVIEKALLCKRIFGNMVRLGTSRPGEGALDVHAVIEEMMPMLDSFVDSRRIRISLELSESLPAVRFSRAHLERILWNLVTNAVEALEDRGGSIVIGTRLAPERRALLSVADDGPGMTSDVLEKVMEPFFSTKENGTGLGLSICRALAWQYGGSLGIESRPDEGTRAIVTLPVDEDESDG